MYIYIENSSLVPRHIPALMLKTGNGPVDLFQEAGHELENSTKVLSMSD
jgi:hypothetical protein